MAGEKEEERRERDGERGVTKERERKERRGKRWRKKRDSKRKKGGCFSMVIKLFFVNYTVCTHSVSM